MIENIVDYAPVRTSLLNGTETEKNFWDFHGEVDYVDHWFLMRSPVPIILLTILYVLFVLKLGPKYMEKRQPFQLRNVLIAYNIIQVAYSCFLVHIGLKLILNYGILSSSCLMDAEDTKFNVTSSTYYYFFAKVTELLDTIFFVLRKKYNQVSFLHVYHHSLMIWITWITLKYEPSYGTIFLGTLNSFIHVIMYSYYALSAFPEISKYLWWKKYLTMMQLVQFGCIILQTIAAHFFSGCSPSYTLFIAITFNCFLFIYLFSSFYIRSYHKNNRKNKEYSSSERNKSSNKHE